MKINGKNQLRLRDAYNYFTKKQKETESPDLEKLKVTITIPTHRVGPDYKQDSLELKNQITGVENKLSQLLSKREVPVIMDHIKKTESLIDYSYNLDGMIMYASKDFAVVVKVPVDLIASNTVGELFDTRPLYKAKQQIKSYYILTISQQKIRLLKVRHDALVLEYNDENFPFENTEYYTTDAKKLAQDVFTDNLIKEFFNVADKQLQIYTADDDLPIILAGEEKSISYFREMMDDDSMVINTLHGNYDNAPTHEIIKNAFPLMEEYLNNKEHEYIEHIQSARSGNLVSFDPNEIFQDAINGNADALYIGENLVLNGNIEEGYLNIDNMEDKNPDSKDLILDLIEKVQDNSGNVVFVKDELLDEYNGLVLIKRY